jgi:hypothetical protein
MFDNTEKPNKEYLLRERLRRRKGEVWRPRLLPRLITAIIIVALHIKNLRSRKISQ